MSGQPQSPEISSSENSPCDNSSLADMRRNYQRAGLSKADCPDSPFEQFTAWFEASKAASPGDWFEVNAMTLSTATPAGSVSARIVLLKAFDERGFVFFTNYDSQKGTELAANPHASLTFYWGPLERQVRIVGFVEKTSREQSEEYFHARPRASQLGAIVSQQSSLVPNRAALETAMQQLETQHEGKEIPVPEHWGGYRVVPTEIEFWQGRPNRLHDRIRYRKEGKAWVLERLAP
ncbi:pyridoxamine 5'-phosphate oxidase [Adhaeretor mobilis]|uniref:Pyridoxine/pyridoxamine 5'-phosphate oxidase n=1 Tax=Adhaeretor mobilis TaxID=1930276 RepID=A0A517N0J9_9BACT|nr:pyridoxamine 5'-phosphate oxidase [Adhaeretor mobilis]QDT00653.1 Pyridoxine/pyridoxamine 5'-phosphate oxidase [Adhaeretor mobilis]